MEYYQREYFISRIVAGYLKMGDLKIYSPTPEINYDANELYMNVYEDAKEYGVWDDQDVYSLLVFRGEWTDEDEENLTKKRPEELETFQSMLLDAFFRFKTTTFNKIKRSYLPTVKREIDRLYNIRHQFDSYTCHGAANQAKYQFIIENTTKTIKGKRYKFNQPPLIQVVNYFNKNAIAPEVFRLLARTTPWVNIWSSAKMNGNPFGVYGANLSNEQQLLLMWTRIYDSMHESPECPPESLFEDDDLVDAWLASQHKKRQEEIKGMAADQISENEKIQNADEVFIPAQTVKDAQDVYEMNTPRNRRIIKDRFQKIQEKGFVKHQEFKDVQEKRMIQLTQEYNRHMRSRKT